MAKQQTALMPARELASLRTKPGDSAEDETETNSCFCSRRAKPQILHFNPSL